MPDTQPRVLVLGTRGVPGAHGGFESFAEKLSLLLVERGWRVTVYCQHDVAAVTQRFSADTWRGVERINVQVDQAGALGTISFDWHSIRHAATQDGVCLVLGYNTAALLALLRARGRKILINMDGIEWQRPKWSRPVRLWFYVNEWLGAWLGQRLVADHPAIADHLATRRPRGAIAMIPYGGDEVTGGAVAPVSRPWARSGELPDFHRAARTRQQHPADSAGVFPSSARRKVWSCSAASTRAIPIMRPSRLRRAVK